MVLPTASIENVAPQESIRVTRTESPTAAPPEFRYPVCNCEPSRRQASRIQNATVAEISFIHAISLYGPGMAVSIFKQMGWIEFTPFASPVPADPSTAAS
jgi:hypothetical protein